MNFLREYFSFKKKMIYCPAKNQPLDVYARSLTFLQKIKSFYYFLLLRKNNSLSIFPKLGDLSNSSILVASGSNLGGAIISIPLFRAIKSRYPNLRIIALANRDISIEILKLAKVADEYIVVPEKTFFQSLYSIDCLKFKQKLIKLNPYAFVSNFDFKLNHILPLKSIKLRFGNIGLSPLNENLNDLSFMFNCGIQVKNTNWLEIYSQISLSLDCGPLESPEINLNFDHSKIFEDFLKTYNFDCSSKYISIQADVWSGESFKAWPYSKVAELCNMLFLKHNLIPIVLGVSSQNNLSNYIKEHFPDLFFIDAIGRTDIKLASVIIKNSCLTLANDSGIMHLSCSLGVPTLAIYGMTDPNVTFVYETSNKHRIIRNIRCRPCFAFPRKLMLSCKSKPCLNDINVDNVYSTIIEMIEK